MSRGGSADVLVVFPTNDSYVCACELDGVGKDVYWKIICRSWWLQRYKQGFRVFIRSTFKRG